jgi:hypothetical protein
LTGPEADSKAKEIFGSNASSSERGEKGQVGPRGTVRVPINPTGKKEWLAGLETKQGYLRALVGKLRFMPEAVTVYPFTEAMPPCRQRSALVKAAVWPWD